MYVLFFKGVLTFKVYKSETVSTGSPYGQLKTAVIVHLWIQNNEWNLLI